MEKRLAVEAVVFDFWNTLFEAEIGTREYHRARARALYEALLEEGLSPPLEKVEWAYREARRICDRIRRATEREVPVEGEVSVMLHLMGLEEEVLDALVEAYLRPFREYLRPVEGAEEVLRALDELGLRVGMLSNTMCGRANREVLERYDLLRYFDALVFSDELGYRKPNPMAFIEVLEELDVLPAEAVMVGDEEADVLGALECGLAAILFKRGGADIPRGEFEVVEELGDILELIYR